MTVELYWLTLTALMTALFWIPYVLNRISVRGLKKAMANPSPDDEPHSPWAARALAAHSNAVENLVVFAALVLVANAAGVSNAITQDAVVVYFVARLGHFLVYLLGIPGMRTLTFAVSWASIMAIGLSILGLI